MEDKQKGFLGKVAAISNRLPHPVTIFILLSIIVGILSVIFQKWEWGLKLKLSTGVQKRLSYRHFL
ncbi:hypothetical protein HMPREF9466_01140 [Fusobacterium necrophorum subsp. funduliforme 1_1_36S]|nr:hypothetical protein HMPREF9466_01140 [Fusobacterium necrophorum subsp. funduliforme 1_1_36S]